MRARFLIAIGESIQLPILVVWAGNSFRGRKEGLVSANVFLAGQERWGG